MKSRYFNRALLAVIVLGVSVYFYVDFREHSICCQKLEQIESMKDLIEFYPSEKLVCYQSKNEEYLVLLPSRQFLVRSGPPAVHFDQKLKMIAYTPELGESSTHDSSFHMLIEKGKITKLPVD